jgi:hypothetical protein
MKDKIEQWFDERRFPIKTEAMANLITQCFADLQPQWVSVDDSTQELLMMFIKDAYASATGKPSKKTAIAMMRYVAADEVLQGRVNNSDYKAILSHKPLPPSEGE